MTDDPRVEAVANAIRTAYLDDMTAEEIAVAALTAADAVDPLRTALAEEARARPGGVQSAAVHGVQARGRHF